MGKTRLRGSFVIRVFQLYSLMDRFRFGGLQRGFLLSSSFSSLITHFGVILCLHISSLLFKLYFYCSLWLNMA